MPLILLPILKIAFGYFIGRIILSFGMAFISYLGINLIIDKGLLLINQYVNTFPAEVINWGNALGVFEAISIILSAYIAIINFKIAYSFYKKFSFGNYD